MAKHIPIRQCVTCRTARPKRELLRVVIDAKGEISLDPTGKKAGRGASCLPQAPVPGAGNPRPQAGSQLEKSGG